MRSRPPAHSRYPSLLVSLIAFALLAGCTSEPAPDATSEASNEVALDTDDGGNDTGSEGGTEVAEGVAATADLAVDGQLTLAAPRDLVAGPEDPYFLHQSLGVWEPLVTVGETLDPVPGLATTWEANDDATSWTFTLLDDVRFSDGSPFDADAVVANIERFIDIAPQPSAFFSLEGGMRLAYGDLVEVAADGPLTVRFELAEPAPALPAMMANFFSMMQAPAAFDADGAFIDGPVGTGPYVLESHRPDVELVLSANPEYRGTAPAFDRVVVRTITDPNARLSALRAGEIDGLFDRGALLPAQLADISAEAEVVGSLSVLTHYLTFNTTKAPFSDADLRRAAHLSVDREAVADILLGGSAQPGTAFLSPVFGDLHDPSIAAPNDPVRAAELVDGADAQGTPITILVWSGDADQYPYTDIAEVLRVSLEQAGFAPTVTVTPASRDAMLAGDYDIFLSAYSLPNADPDYLFRRFLVSDSEWNLERNVGYLSTTFDDLVDTAVRTTDPTARIAAYHDIQQLLDDELPMSPVAYQSTYTVSTDGVTGLVPDVVSTVDLGAVAPS